MGKKPGHTITKKDKYFIQFEGNPNRMELTGDSTVQGLDTIYVGEFIDKPKSRLTIEGNIITDTRTGAIGEVIKKDRSYLVHLTEFGTNDTPKKKKAISQRMADWYVFTQVKKKK